MAPLTLSSRRFATAGWSRLGEFRVVVAAGVNRLAVFAVSGLLMLITTRVVITSVGASYYGAISLVATLITLLPFAADLGTNAAIINAVTETGDVRSEHVRRTCITAARVSTVTALVIVSGAGLILAVGAWPTLMGAGGSHLPHLGLATFLALAAFACGLPFGIARGVLVGDGKNHIYVLLSGFYALVALGTAWAMHLADAQPYVFAVVTPAALTTGAVVACFVTARICHVPMFGYLREVFRFRIKGTRIRSSSWSMLLIMLGLGVAVQSDRLVLSHTRTGNLAVYAIAAQLFTPLWGVVSTASVSLWPILARKAEATGHVRRLLHLVAAFTAVGVAEAALLVLLGPWFADVISAGSINVGHGVLLAFAGLLLVQAAHQPSGMSLTSPAGLRFQARCVVAIVPVNLVLSVVLARFMGTPGPVWASAGTIFLLQAVPCFARACRRPAQPDGVATPELNLAS